MNLKKTVLIASMVIPTMLFSQTDLSSKLPKSGIKMVELNFNPFGSNGVFSFDNLQAKYWLSEKTVLRMGVGYSAKNNVLTDDDFDSKEQYKTNIDESSTLLCLKPGVEFRLLKNSKISPYVGVELMYKNKSANSNYKEYTQTYDYNTQKYKYDFLETKIDGGWREYSTGTYATSSGTYSYTSISYGKERAFKTYGANLLLGSDFYFIKNMYFGFEVGLGYESTLYQKIKVDISTNVNPITLPSYNMNKTALYYNSAIRFGIWF